MKRLSKAQWMGIIRHLLTALGGFVVAQGTMNDGVAEQLVGGVTALIGFLWSVNTKEPVAPAVEEEDYNEE
jgi:hypothetical protein